MSHRALGLLALALAGASALPGRAVSPTVSALPSAAAGLRPRVTVPAERPPPPAVRTPAPPRAVSARPAPVPTRVVIPTIDVDAPLVRLGLDPAGALEVPATREDAGWFTGAARPGEVGPAIIAGHVSLARGPAVFRDLSRLRPRDEIAVHGDDGRITWFVVTRTEQYAKDAFPTALVYGPTSGRELRLITCGGEIDPATRHFRDNVVVFATAV